MNDGETLRTKLPGIAKSTARHTYLKSVAT